jgi:hypothetical protein
MKKLYLAGGIWGIKDPFGWRHDATEMLPEGWEAVDPLKLSGGIWKEGDDAVKLIDTDLTAIEESNALACRIDVASWGSAMELFYAHELGMPTIGLRLDKHHALAPGPWLRVHCSIIVTSLIEMRDYLAKEGWVHAAS